MLTITTWVSLQQAEEGILILKLLQYLDLKIKRVEMTQLRKRSEAVKLKLMLTSSVMIYT